MAVVQRSDRIKRLGYASFTYEEAEYVLKARQQGVPWWMIAEKLDRPMGTLHLLLKRHCSCTGVTFPGRTR